MSDLLKITLLGTPQISINGESLTGAITGKYLALFVYLAVTNQMHMRDVLAGLLWSEMSDSQARKNLRDALAHIRRHVGDYLTITRHSLGFNAQNPYWLDVEILRTQVQADTTKNNPQLLQSIVDLYHGDFLAGFHVRASPVFEEWVRLQREYLRNLELQGLYWLGAHYLTQRQYEQGLAVNSQLLALDPEREDAHRQRMRLLAASGQRSSALVQYHTCQHILQEEFGVAPAAETMALYEQIKAGAFDEGWAKEQGASLGFAQDKPRKEQEDTRHPPPATRPLSIDWSEIPRTATFYGRQEESKKLVQWLGGEGCRLVAIFGMGGQGKTALAAHVMGLLAGDRSTLFTQIIWSSLVNAPPLAEVLQGWLQRLAGSEGALAPDRLDEQLTRLMQYLRHQRCLLVLDNLESILQRGEHTGRYRPGYEPYAELLRRVGESDHASCLLLTSRERPREFTRLEEHTPTIRSLQLDGLSSTVGRQILQAHGLAGLDDSVDILLRRYSGNPLALILVAETIWELFGGSVKAFLAEEVLIFDDIRDVLDQQFVGLSPTEKELLLWLAVERTPTSFQKLWSDLVTPQPKRAYLEAQRSLLRRSLLEANADSFSLQNVVMEYITDQLVETVVQELLIDHTHPSTNFFTDAYFNRYPLVKAQSKDFVRASQTRLLLQPVAQRLLTRWGKEGVAKRLCALLGTLRAEIPLAPGYAATNILHLLLYLEIDVRGYDFSRLTVWQAYLRGANLPETNFAQADLANSVFTESMVQIGALAFSPDGEWLAASSTGGQIYLWRTADQQVWRVLTGHGQHVRGLAFSPDGQFLASGGASGTLSFWRLPEITAQSQPTHFIEGHSDEVAAVAFSPHPAGHYLFASASSDHTAQVWELIPAQAPAHEPELTLQHRRILPHPQRVATVAFSPDGRTLATGSADYAVRLWDVATGELCQTWSGHTDALFAVAFSPDGRLLASASADRTVRLWDVTTGQVQHVLDKHDWIVGTVAFSPDGNRVATGSHDQMVRFWDVHSGQLLGTLVGHTYVIWALAFSPDGKTLASGGADHTARLWDAHSGQPLQTLRGHPRPLRAVALSPRQVLAGVGHDQMVYLWQLDGAASELPYQILRGHTDRLHAVAFSSDGRTLASAGADQIVRLWDSQSSQLCAALSGHSDVIYTVAFSPDQQLLASGGRDRTIRLWDVQNGQLLATLSGHTSEINSVAFHPAGRLLVSASGDQTVRLWDLTREGAPEITSERIMLQEYDDFDGTAVAFSPNGAYLACSSTRLVFVWEMVSEGKPQRRHTLKAHTSWVLTIAFSPDGTTLASASIDMTICLWDVQSGQLRHRIQEYIKGPNSVVFSADGTQLFTAGSDGRIICWDVTSGQRLQTLRTEEPYAGMNITGVLGLTEAQKVTLKVLGAVEGAAEE